MGLSHVAAAALLWSGLTFVGFSVAKDAFEHDARIEEDWALARALEHDVAATSMDIVQVTQNGPTITVDATNDGQTTIDISSVSVLFDGVPQTVASSNVEGSTTAVWPARTDAQLNVTAGMPASVLLVTKHGVQAVWRI